MYWLLIIKRFIEDIFIFPFILLGRLAAFRYPMKKEYRVFFFFPFYHTGGAEKVHAQIAEATGGNDCIIFFTKRSVDNRFLNDFKKSGCEIRNISKFTGDRWLYFLNLFYRGIITGYINGQKQKPIVFNGQCNFGYKISPWIKKNIKQVELIHSLNSFSYIRIPFLPFIDSTVMISRKRIEDHKTLYKRYKIPASYIEKIHFIQNAIVLPQGNSQKEQNSFIVLYVGRSTKEKRVHLVAKTAEMIAKIDNTIKFEIAGDVKDIINTMAHSNIHFHDTISDNTQLQTIYSKAHVLILTSSTEGSPLVVMEAMANGCAILATAVGDIPQHVIDGKNGFLFSSAEDEAVIVKEAVEKICWLKNNRDLLNKMSLENINYAEHNFGIEKFKEEYRKLLFQ